MSHRTRNRPPPSDQTGLPLIFCLLAIFVGVALAYVLSDFVFLDRAAYVDFAWPAFLILLPVITIGLLASPRGKLWRGRLSLARLPHLFGWALGIAVLAGAIVSSPYGYLAMFNEVVGYDVTVKAKVVSVWDVAQGEGRDKRRCTRLATVLVGSRKTSICLGDHYKPNDNIQGEDVLMQVRQSPFGYSMGQISLAR
jgi:hypothetical protein